MRLLHQTATFSLTHDPAHNWLYSHWSGVNTAEMAKAACEVILIYVRRLKCTKLLNDGLADEDGWGGLSNWVAEAFIQKLAQEGIVAIAWVLSTHSHALHATQKVLQKLAVLKSEGPLLDVFTDTESAYAWLTQWPECGSKVN